MHIFLLGIVGVLMKITKHVLGEKNFNEVFDKFEHKFFIPTNFGRFPRSIKIFKKKMKAEEYKNLLLIFAVPLLGDFTNNNQILKLWKTAKELLCNILNYKNVEDIEYIGELSSKLYKMISNYGDQFCIPKVHFLEHFKLNFSWSGSMIKNSLFTLENLNSLLKDLNHATLKVEKQIIVSTILNNIRPHFAQLIPTETTAHAVLFYSNNKSRIAYDINFGKKDSSHFILILGNECISNFSMNEYLNKLVERYNCDIFKVKYWNRISINNCIIETAQYCKKYKHNNSFILYKPEENVEEIGRCICCFTISGSYLFCVIETFECIGEHKYTGEKLYFLKPKSKFIINPSNILRNIVVFINKNPYEYEIKGKTRVYVELYMSYIKY